MICYDNPINPAVSLPLSVQLAHILMCVSMAIATLLIQFPLFMPVDQTRIKFMTDGVLLKEIERVSDCMS